MPKKSTRLLPFVACLTTLFLGITLGIVSQRFSEIKALTDEIIQPIEKSEILKQVKATIAYPDETIYITEPYSVRSNSYVQDQPLPGQPISSFLIHRPGYSVAYDARHRNPAWVYEHLTADHLANEPDLFRSDFKEDVSIPPHLRATLVDYKGHGLDRGHMAPTADHLASQEEMSDTFYMTNMCPQCPQFNRGYWAKLEKHIRNLTKDYQNVYVTTGPLYLPMNENHVRFVKYRVIGPNDVAVPSHFFKVLILEDKQGKKDMIAYVLPNQEIPTNTPLDSFRTTVQRVEKLAGLVIAPQ